MKKRLLCSRVLSLGILFLTFLLNTSFGSAGVSDSLVVYVWDFVTREREKDNLTRNLSEEFEEAFIRRECARVLERRNFDRLIAHIDNEKAILELDSVSATTIDSLRLYQANTVVFGEVYYDTDNGEIKVGITFQSFDGTKEVWSTRFDMKDQYDAARREKAMEKLAKEICPDGNGVGPGRYASVIGHSAAALVSAVLANNYSGDADEARGNIPAVLSGERVKAFGEYKKLQTRQHWSSWTAVNFAVTSLPFWFDVTNAKPRIGKWPIFSTFLTGSATFFAFALIEGKKADDALEKLETDFSQLSEERVIHWGKYLTHLERKDFLLVNAAVDLLAAVEILLWYDRGDEAGRGLHVYLDTQKSTQLRLGLVGGESTYDTQIGIVLQKSF